MRHFPLRKQPGPGFTFLQVMLGITVLALSSAMLLRSFQASLEDNRLRNAAIELSGFLEAGRRIALAQASTCTLGQTTSTSGIFAPKIIFFGSANACTAANLPRANLRESTPNISASIDGAAPDRDIVFTARGLVTAETTIRLTSTRTTGAWCVNITAPLAVVRIGYQAGTGSTCSYLRL